MSEWNATVVEISRWKVIYYKDGKLFQEDIVDSEDYAYDLRNEAIGCNEEDQ